MAKSRNSTESKPQSATYHLSVVGIVRLFDEWELLPSQCLEDGYHLGKLQKTRNNIQYNNAFSVSEPDKTSVRQ